MLRNLTVKQKITFPIIALIALFAVSSIVNVVTSKQQGELTYKLNQVVVPTLFNIEDAYRDLYQATSAIQGIALAENNQEAIDFNKFEYEDNAYKAIPRMKKAQVVVDEGVMPATLNKDIQLLEEIANKWLASYESLLSNPQEQWGPIYQVNKTLYDNQFVAVREQLNVVKDQIEAERNTLQEEIAAAASKASAALEIGTSIVIILAMATCWLLINAIVKPLVGIQQAMEEIASGDGDLNKTISSNSNDEIGKLAASFNLFVAKIRSTIQQVVVTNTAVKNELSSLVEISQGIGEQTQLQRQESELVSTAVNEMQATSQVVSDNARDAANVSQQADVEVHTTNKVLDQTVESIRLLATEIDQASGVVNHLSSDVGDIASVLDVIKGIAEQTNLLALNAAIEAARAGEQGRGFAVVADEVRSLASRTQQSTGEIQAMIEKLQQGAEQAVEVMNSSRNSSESTIDSAAQATQSLQVIFDAIASMNDMNTHIASAAQQQTAVSEEVSQNIVRIASNSAQVVDNVQHAESRITGLNQQCDELDRLVSQFKC
ncbi:methyl-accepting chemotaxis protein [Vibrio panuliri]|uniref:Chemotaxis protein n=1 Tax=Vibrio panuliri TaxID=1381081 RepID=A0ABX3FDF8_9VIBR|nr:methyl-accepting chemotaxis protein [Vibrio panuliri]KAB1454449.1 methyl-accepting chemotaxis protein [Vibrio panuliri]OLQ89988.1 chemotaxis protein [Vibrio panuliri]